MQHGRNIIRNDSLRFHQLSPLVSILRNFRLSDTADSPDQKQPRRCSTVKIMRVPGYLCRKYRQWLFLCIRNLMKLFQCISHILCQYTCLVRIFFKLPYQNLISIFFRRQHLLCPFICNRFRPTLPTKTFADIFQKIFFLFLCFFLLILFCNKLFSKISFQNFFHINGCKTCLLKSLLKFRKSKPDIFFIKHFPRDSAYSTTFFTGSMLQRNPSRRFPVGTPFFP